MRLPGRTGQAGKVLLIAGVSLRRLLRDRTYAFFLLIAPLGLVLILGLAFGEGMTPGLGVVAPEDDPLAAEIVTLLEGEEGVTVVRYGTEEDLRLGVERAEVEAGAVIPAGYTDRLRRGETLEVGFLARPAGPGAQLQTVVQSAVAGQSVRLQAARFGAARGAADFEEALALATRLEGGQFARVDVATATVGDEDFPEDLGQFDISASSQLLLFVFVNGMASSAVLIENRRLGVTRRMLSTPTSTGAIVTGEAMGRIGVTVFQGAYIMLATWVLFGVDWGDPLAAGALVLLFCLVAAGASMLVGAVFSHPEQAQGAGIFGGLCLAALGGSMAPLEVFSPLMRDVAHVTPHAWGNDAFAALVREGGGLVDILPELGVLGAMAAALLALAVWRLRATLTSG